jgi:hypothetical protein
LTLESERSDAKGLYYFSSEVVNFEYNFLALLKIKWVKPCSFDRNSWKISDCFMTVESVHGHAGNIQYGTRN